ncbi:MAG: hypothetical protein IJ518_06545 [Clostridia bacterium]|nr:hypothetical protein [Clostridia bacterium]
MNLYIPYNIPYNILLADTAVASLPHLAENGGLLAEITPNLVLGTLYPHKLPLSTNGNRCIFGDFSQRIPRNAWQFPFTHPCKFQTAPPSPLCAKKGVFHGFCGEKTDQNTKNSGFF